MDRELMNCKMKEQKIKDLRFYCRECKTEVTKENIMNCHSSIGDYIGHRCKKCKDFKPVFVVKITDNT